MCANAPPIAAQQGLCERSLSKAVMQQEQFDNPTTLSYGTDELPRPLWVHLGLWGLPNRGSAWVFFWICTAFASISVARGFSDPRWFWGAGMYFAAHWYRAAIHWVDLHSSWD
jgi:hypothetical protein